MRRLTVLVIPMLLAACTSAPKIERSVASISDAQKAAGFKLEQSTEVYNRFTFRNEGDFLISKDHFQTREDASEFCASQPGYELAGWLFAGVLTMSSLPFDELRESSVIKNRVLDGKGSINGGSRSGVIFWIKGSTPTQESQLARGRDFVYALLNGCGPACDGVDSLAVINSDLRRLGETPKAPPAVCVSAALKRGLAN